jgi:glycosyltransferase involved in cell wall biosynthesis
VRRDWCEKGGAFAAPAVLLGPIANDPAESVSAVNRALIEGLGGNYAFLQAHADRRYGLARQARFNGWNVAYFLKHLLIWIWHLLRRQPNLAHYALASGWAMEKSLVFLAAARWMGAYTVAHLHGGAFLHFWDCLPTWRKWWALRVLRRLDGLVVLSEGWKRAIVQTLGLPEDRVFVVHNPIDKGFESAALEMPVERAAPLVLCLGVMEKAKGIWDILTAADMLRAQCKVQFVLAGPEREPDIHRKVKAFIDTHSLQETVCLRGVVWGQDKIELFRKASIFLLPSYFENFPLVVLEAAAAGSALVTTPVGAIPEFFEHGVSALFVEPGKPDQIAEAIQWLVEHPDERVRLGRAAREVFTTRLGRDKIMADMDRVYQAILSRPRV